MAKRVTVDLVDDYDPNMSADETVTFALDHITYEVDLSTKNAEKLRNELQPWINVARRTSGTRRRRTTSTTSGSALPLSEIRAWANANGVAVSQRGRVSAAVVRAYNSAQTTQTTQATPEKPARKTTARKSASKAKANGTEAPAFSSQ